VRIELQRLVFFDFVLEKSFGGGRGFFMLFTGVFEGGFGKCTVFWWRFCGELLVDSWWIVVC
jgi:hypothetical protein